MAPMKLKSDYPDFAPASKASLSEAEKHDLFVHVLRLPEFFEQALHYIPKILMQHETEERQVLVVACHELAERSVVRPGDKQFKRVLKQEIIRVGKEYAHDGIFAETADELVEAGGFIDEAFEVDPAELSLELAQNHLKRYLYEAEIVAPLVDFLSLVASGDRIPADLPGVLEQLLERTRRHEGINAKTVKSFEEEWQEHQSRLKQFRGRTLIGLKTGLAELDKKMLGLRGLIIFGAKPGAGKTTCALVMAIGVCSHHADNDCVVVFVCLDMDRFELYRRIHCNLGDIEWVPLMFGSPEELREPGSMFSKTDSKRLKTARARLKNEQIGKRLVIPDRTVLGEDVTAQRLSGIIQAHKEKAGAKRALLIIDYLQLIPVPEEVTARGDLAADKYRVRVVQQVIERSRTADDPLGDTALVISEARKPPTSKDKDTWGDSMSELMGSARLGYAGDAVVLNREMNNKEMETYYGVKSKEAAEKKRKILREQSITPVMLILEKGRDGMIRGKWGAEFNFQKSKLRELTPNQHLMALVPPSSDDEESDASGQDVPSPGEPLPLPPNDGFQAKLTKKSKGKKKAASGPDGVSSKVQAAKKKPK